jgi:putative phage-type endonuclease
LKREVLIPKDREEWLAMRAKDLTSTEVPALFNLSPYMTRFELLHRKRSGQYVDGVSKYTTWGNRLEEAIAKGVAEDNGWEIRKANEYIRLPEERLGASFDYFIGEDGIHEIKNVDQFGYKNTWLVDPETREIEAPAHIEIQVQVQILVSGRPNNHISALVGGNTVKQIHRTANADMHRMILNEVRNFWSEVDSGATILPDFDRDAEFINSLYGYAEPGKVVDALGDVQLTSLAAQYREVSEQIKELENRKAGLKAQMLMAIGDAEKVLGGGFSISAGTVGPCPMNYVRSGYRTFRINWRKGNGK